MTDEHRACPADCECKVEYDLGEPIQVQRRRKGGRLDAVLTVRLAPGQLDALGELAEQDRGRLSDLARAAIAEYITRRTSNLVVEGSPQSVNAARPVFRLTYSA